MEGLFSTKSDVYSFGVLLLEVVTGIRRNFNSETMGFSSLIVYVSIHIFLHVLNLKEVVDFQIFFSSTTRTRKPYDLFTVAVMEYVEGREDGGTGRFVYHGYFFTKRNFALHPRRTSLCSG
jgi:hypothetical protein